MTRTVGLAGPAYLLFYIVASFVTGQRFVWMDGLLQLVPSFAFAGFTLSLALRSRGPARIFWNLNAASAVMWAAGQVVAWTYLDHGGAEISPAHPIFFLSSIPLAAALYVRPDRDRSRLLFSIVGLDIVLIALFLGFVDIYFDMLTGAADGFYRTSNLALFHARNLFLALWAAFVWRTAQPAWRRVLGVYAIGLAIALVSGVINAGFIAVGPVTGLICDLSEMATFVVLAIAAAMTYDEQLFEPAGEPNRIWPFPVVSLIATMLLVAIPAIDIVARQSTSTSPAIADVRTRLALALLIPFGVVLVAREFLSRRALVNAARQLAAAREQLAQKERLAAVGQLVPGVAHELNNPLQGVIGYTELLLAGKNTATENEELKAILNNATRAAGIVRNLLAFARRVSSARGWQQMNRIVRDAVAVRERHVRAARIELRMDLADRLPLVYVDQARLKEVVVSLIQNAEAAVTSRQEGEKSRAIVPAREPGEVVVSTKWKTKPDRIVVEVADNGRGLTADELARIFDPLHPTQSPAAGGGSGLSECYRIVREHGGEITASNVEFGGAALTIELPVMAESLASEAIAAAGSADVPAPAETRHSAPAAFAVIPRPEDDLDKTPRRRTALVVDDEESNAALVRRVLVRAGYDVESTTLSRRALVMIERIAYDAVICDVKMPELGGQELYRRVCQIRPEMSRRFIFITGDIDGEDTRQFLDQSRCSFFMKPFNLERLTAAVDMITGSMPPDTIG